MKKTFLLIAGILLFSNISLSDKVPESIAEAVARNFIKMELKYEFDNLILAKTISRNNNPLCYYFNFPSKNGYIIVAADDHVHPILGYSDKHVYRENDIFPPQYVSWMNNYFDQIEYVIQNSIFSDNTIDSEWRNLLNNTNPADRSTTNVSPLLTTVWNQGCYFNGSCPVDAGGPCGRAYTGCVATAMAQIMKYHNWPLQGTGSHSYTHPVYGTVSANFGTTTYNWSDMPDNVTSSNSSVATLLYHCGVSVEMNYGPDESGASTADVVYALETYFDYDPVSAYYSKSNYSTTEWEDLLKADLDNSRPIQYRGSGPDGGHSFVCDGYSGTNYFHFNWGWGGAYDGYFYLSNLNPGGYTYNVDQAAILNIQPHGTTVLGLQLPSTSDAEQVLLDYNGDDHVDLLWYVRSTPSLKFYQNTGTDFVYDFEITIPPYSNAPFHAHNGIYTDFFYKDIDNDGSKDLLIYSANHMNCTSNSIRIYWGNNSTYFNSSDYLILTANSPYCVGAVLVDIDNDGLTDVHIRSASGVCTMYKNNGSRNFSQITTFNTGRDIYQVFFDVDEDGFKDLIYGKSGWADGQWGFRFNEGLGNGNFNSSTQVYYASERVTPESFAPINLNQSEDNIMDFVFLCGNDGTNNNTLYMAKWNDASSNFNFTTRSVGNNNLENSTIAPVDYNGDGYTDIVLRYKNNSTAPFYYTTYALLNDGLGNFNSADTFLLNSRYSPYSVWKDEDAFYVAAFRMNNAGNAWDYSVVLKYPAVKALTSLNNITVSDGQSRCYNATQTITVAGDGTTFTVESDGDATLIAGKNILLMPGTMIYSGGHLLAYITTNGNYCGSQQSTMVSTAFLELENEPVMEFDDSGFRVYPNPTTGKVNLEFNQVTGLADCVVQIFNMSGARVLAESLKNVKQYEFDLSGQLPGIYIIQVIQGNRVDAEKLVKQ